MPIVRYIEPNQESKLNGNFWEYYHFIVECCSFVASLLEKNGKERIQIYVPNTRWCKFGIYHPKHPHRDFSQHFNFLFNGLVLWTPYEPRNIRSLTRIMNAQPIHWKQAIPPPTAAMFALQRHAWGLLPEEHLSSEPRQRTIVIQRISTCIPDTGPDPIRNHITKFGAARRTLPTAFFSFFENQPNTSVVVLENMPLLDQIALFYGASCVVAQHGAGLSNILFCRPGTKVIEINDGSMGHVDFRDCFKDIAKQMRLQYTRAVDQDTAIRNYTANRPNTEE